MLLLTKLDTPTPLKVGLRTIIHKWQCLHYQSGLHIGQESFFWLETSNNRERKIEIFFPTIRLKELEQQQTSKH